MSNEKLNFIVQKEPNEGYVSVKLHPRILRSIANRLKSTGDMCRVYRTLRKLGHVLEETAIEIYENKNDIQG